MYFFQNTCSTEFNTFYPVRLMTVYYAVYANQFQIIGTKSLVFFSVKFTPVRVVKNFRIFTQVESVIFTLEYDLHQSRVDWIVLYLFAAKFCVFTHWAHTITTDQNFQTLCTHRMSTRLHYSWYQFLAVCLCTAGTVHF